MSLAILSTLATLTTAFSAPTGCPDFEVELPRPANGAVVRAADFGFSETNDNNIVAINAALAEAKRVGASRVELAPGTYRCFDDENCKAGQTFLAANPGIAIEGFADFTFDGKGATLVFRRDHEPLQTQDTLLEYGANVTIRGCRRTVVENFNMDWDWETDPLAVWCRCVGKHVDDKDDSSWADFELEAPHPKYPRQVPVQLMTPYPSDKSGSQMDVENGPRYLLGTSLGCIGSKSEWLSPTRLRVWPAVRPASEYCPPQQAGLSSSEKNLEYVQRIRVGGTYTLSHCYYGLNGFVLDSNEHFTLRNVDLWSCRGFGVETRGAQKYWQLVNFNIRQKPGERRPVTSTADAHHFVRSRGYGKMIGCETEMSQDDYFNIHDRTQIAQKRSARTVEVVNSSGIGYTQFKAGSRIRLRHEDYSDAGWTGNIVKIDGEFVTFDRDLPEQKGMLFVLIDDEYASENFLFKDCWFHDAPWARGLVQGNNVTFDGCVFGPMSGLPLKFMTCYSYNVWCEGIGCSNIVVRNCRFENCLADNSWQVLPGAPLITASMLLPPEYSRMEDSVPIANPGFARQVAANKAAGRKVKPSADAVCDILIEKNTFVNPRGLVLLTENASRVTFRDNKVESDGSAWEPFPFAGKIRLVGGNGNDVQEEYLESSLDRRVEDTLARLTLEQKIGQLWQGLGRDVIEPASGDMSGEKLKESFLADVRAGRYGSLIGKRGVENYNVIQRAAMEGVGIPLLIGNDMIHSVVTTYPIPLALACSWDESLWERVASAMAGESLLQGCNWTFAPMIDVALDARWGRIAEGGGCDPLLTGLMGAAMIRGFQGEDMADGLHIAACAKHYVCYGASLGGRDYNAVELSDDALRNTYLPPFKMAVDAGVATVMPAFHSYNGVPCSMDRYLLRDILRTEMGFDGMTISDWGAVKQLVVHGTASDESDAAEKALDAGMDMEMVSECYIRNLPSIVKEGRVRYKTLDDAVRNVLRVKFRLGLFDHPEIDKSKVAESVDLSANRALAREAAQKSTVLLKNNGVLPLAGGTCAAASAGVKVALLGDVSASDWQMLGCWSTEDLSNFENATLLDGLKADGVDVSYTEAYTLTGRVDVAEIEKAAGDADVVVAAFGDYWEKSGEGNSSSKIELPGNQLDVARAVKACGRPLVAVVFGGRPMAFPDLAELADAVVMAWNPGGCGGWGIADVLTGVVEPWGRLTVDIPRTTGVCPLFYSQTTTGRPAVVDKDNPFGRRYTSCYNDIEPSALYPFGFGLTYTTFEMKNEECRIVDDAGWAQLVATVDVTNAGKRDGSELVQLYVRDNVAKIARPRRELKSFKRVELKAGETKHVELRVPVANLGYWTKGSHVVEPGAFTAWIASDSESGRPIGFDLVIPER